MTGIRTNARMARPLATVGRRMARSRLHSVVVATTEKAALPHSAISVMTYNILAQKYVQNGWHSYCPSKHLKWSYRKQLLLEELEGYDSDIICLQEVEAGVFSRELQPWLEERGYRGHYLARQYGENVQGPPEGVALFYRTAMFELVRHRAFIFSSVATDPPAPRCPSLSSSDGDDAAAADQQPAAAAAAASGRQVSRSGGRGGPASSVESVKSVSSVGSVGSDSEAQASDSEEATSGGKEDEEEEAERVKEEEEEEGVVVSGPVLAAAAAAGSMQSSLARRGAGGGGDGGGRDTAFASSSPPPQPQPAGSTSAAAGAVALAGPEPGRNVTVSPSSSSTSASTSGSGNGNGKRSGSNGSGSSINSNGNGNDSGAGAGKKGRGRDPPSAATASTSSSPSASASALTSLDRDPSPSRAASPLPSAAEQSAPSTSDRSSSSSGSSSSSSSSGSSSSQVSGRGRGGGGRGNNEFWSVFTRRQEGAILALLRHKPTRRPLLAAVTHLFWNPAFPDVKAFQAATLCREMAAFLRGAAGGGEAAVNEVPVVLAGDFNSHSRKRLPDMFDPKIPRGREGLVSGVYTLLTRGSLPPDHPDHPASRRRAGETGNPDFRGLELTTSGIALASAYRIADGREPPLTTRTATFAGCLDYIFVSPHHFDVTSTLELPYDLPAAGYDAVRDPLSDVAFAPIPNAAYPSDHLSLVAQVRLKAP